MPHSRVQAVLLGAGELESLWFYTQGWYETVTALFHLISVQLRKTEFNCCEMFWTGVLHFG